jgi:membrane-bound lytic murein transglycosylase D
MTIKQLALSFFLLISISVVSQETVQKTETKTTYLDSIKKTFVNDNLAACVDSLWLKELTDLDIYNHLSEDIQTFNTDEKTDYELPTELLKARLQAMDQKSPFHIEYNQGLENIIKLFLKNRKRSFERLMAVSEYYFPLFEAAFDKYNVPLEIKYLAVVESALNPKAVSKSGATGLWQFMYQTGKQYGLQIDSYVDERSDPLKASEAAAQYMKNMHAIFGDWDLVLASYNSGPGNVAKAIRRSNGQQNYWNIRKKLPKETQGYLPAFLATMYIYEYHKEHGIQPQKAPIKSFATDTIHIKKQLSFKQISELIDIPIAQLQILNPSYKLNIVPSYNDQSHYLRLPQDKIGLFASNEAAIYAYADREESLRERPFEIVKPIISPDLVAPSKRLAQAKVRYYRVKKGDNLSEIAKKYDIALDDLKKWNNIKGNSVAFGKNLKISISSDAEPKSTAIAKAEIAKKGIQNDSIAEKTDSFYVVQKGDNLSTIAKKFEVSIADLQEWNNLRGPAIALGASLQVTKNATSKTDLVVVPERKDIEYTVQKGDNLGNIAKKFGASIDDLKQWNALSSNSIALGNTLIVAKNEMAIVTNKTKLASFKKKEDYSASTKKTTIEYYVKKGDSLYSISKKYPGVTIFDLKKWNKLEEEELKPGMKLKING